MLEETALTNNYQTVLPFETFLLDSILFIAFNWARHLEGETLCKVFMEVCTCLFNYSNTPYQITKFCALIILSIS